jgi:hypothetical protein
VLTIGLSFGAVLPDLAATRRVVAPEMQGHGHPAGIEREMSVPDLASDVVALLDDIDRADFQEMTEAYAAVAPDPGHFEAFMARCDARLAVLPDTTHTALMRRTQLLLPILEEFLG